LALYSSRDEVIAGRTSRWPNLAEAHDLPWLSHDTDSHKEALARLIVPYMSDADQSREGREAHRMFLTGTCHNRGEAKATGLPK
jgi:hypothetical protein